MYKIKEYLISNLLDNKEEIKMRCSLIENLSLKFDFLPETKFILSNKKIIYKQNYIKKIRTDNLTFKKVKEYIENFANCLDSLSSFNFVHGDINYSNVVFDGLKFNLIDFEPSFFQKKNGKVFFKSGENIRSSNDKLSKKVTAETDKIGFYFFTKKVYFDLYKSQYKFNYTDEYLLQHEELIIKKKFLEISGMYFK